MSKQNNKNLNPSEKETNIPNLNEIEEGEITNDFISSSNNVIIIFN